jgi:hypothetical protein
MKLTDETWEQIIDEESQARGIAEQLIQRVSRQSIERVLGSIPEQGLTDKDLATLEAIKNRADREYPASIGNQGAWLWVMSAVSGILSSHPAPAPEPQNEALQKLCESLYCPAGINRVAFLANKIKDLQKRVKILQKQADGLCDGCSKPLEDAYCTKCSGRADLDWEPTKTRTVADMANIGNEYMDAVADLMPKANWDESPVELFSNLFDERPISPQEPA